jgi:hypothetical protein
MNKSHPLHVELGWLFRFCRVIRWLMLAFLVIQVVFFLLPWIVSTPFSVGPVRMHINLDGMTRGAVATLSASQKFAGMLVGLPGLVALTYGIVRLSMTLTRLQQGRIFTADTITYLRTSAGATLLSIVLFILEKPLRGIAFNALGNGNRYPIAIDVTSNELLLILVCSLFYLIVGVLQEGRRLSEENEGFI